MKGVNKTRRIYIYIIEEGGNHCRYLFQWGGVHVKSKLSKEK